MLLLLQLYLLSYDKVALVMGNANYAEGKLKRPTTDATKIGEFLATKAYIGLPI